LTSPHCGIPALRGFGEEKVKQKERGPAFRAEAFFRHARPYQITGTRTGKGPSKNGNGDGLLLIKKQERSVEGMAKGWWRGEGGRKFRGKGRFLS